MSSLVRQHRGQYGRPSVAKSYSLNACDVASTVPVAGETVNRQKSLVLSSRSLPSYLDNTQDVIKMINHIKGHALHSWLFVQLCEEMDAEHTIFSHTEGYLEEGEDMRSIDELWRNVADDSKGSDDHCTRYQHPPSNDASSWDIWKEGLFQHFYQMVQKARDRERPSDCIIVSVNKEQREYATVIGHRLQDHGLTVEMIHLTSESGLTRALQEIKDDGSPFCVLVEQSSVRLSSCTVITLHEPIKIHRHMPLEDALVLVAEAYRRLFAQREQQTHAGISLRAGELVDDFLARECLTSYPVPMGVRHLLFLLNEGKHLHRSELDLLIDYLKTRRGQLEGLETPSPLTSSDHSSFQGRSTPVVGRPPLLPTPGTRAFLSAPPAAPAKSPGDGLLPSPAPSKRTALLGFTPAKPGKRPLLGEKPGLLATPPAHVQVAYLLKQGGLC